jgi:hypothetical protein
MARGRAAGTDVACSGQRESSCECGVTGREGFLRQRDEVKAMAASGTIAGASLL